MKKRQQGMVLGILVGSIGIGGVAHAKDITETITIRYDNIRMAVDGIPVQLKTANGALIEPFIYNGTAYLPVRAVGEALGKDVAWDGNTKDGIYWRYTNAKAIFDECLSAL